MLYVLYSVSLQTKQKIASVADEINDPIMVFTTIWSSVFYFTSRKPEMASWAAIINSEITQCDLNPPQAGGRPRISPENVHTSRSKTDPFSRSQMKWWYCFLCVLQLVAHASAVLVFSNVSGSRIQIRYIKIIFDPKTFEKQEQQMLRQLACKTWRKQQQQQHNSFSCGLQNGSQMYQ